MANTGLTDAIVRTRTVDGVAIRYADSGEDPGPTLLMTNPWPESLFAFRRIWSRLASAARLVAIDLPGFGHSEARDDLFAPTTLSEFLNTLIAEWDLGRPHVLAPDVGTSAALFLASRHPDSVTSVTVGSGGAAYPLEVTGVLADMIAAPTLEGLRDLDIRAGVGTTVDAVASRTGEPDVWEDYVTSYENGRFAESARYVRSYPVELQILAELLPAITTPVQVINAQRDSLVPPSNGQFLHDRLPVSRLITLDSGHFPWEESAHEYGEAVANWITGGFEDSPGRSQTTEPPES